MKKIERHKNRFVIHANHIASLSPSPSSQAFPFHHLPSSFFSAKIYFEAKKSGKMKGAFSILSGFSYLSRTHTHTHMSPLVKHFAKLWNKSFLFCPVIFRRNEKKRERKRYRSFVPAHLCVCVWVFVLVISVEHQASPRPRPKSRECNMLHWKH